MVPKNNTVLFKKFLEPLASSHEILIQIFKNKKMFFVFLLSIFYWLVIGAAAYFILQGFCPTFKVVVNKLCPI